MYRSLALILMIATVATPALAGTAEDCAQTGNVDLAITACTAAIATKPKDAKALNARGTAYLRKGDHAKAIADYSEAIKANKKGATAYNNRGFVYGLTGDRPRAIADFTAALKANPKLVAALDNRVGALASQEGEACTVNGTVVDTLNAQFAEGIEMRTLAVQSYVVAKAACAKQQIWIEAFGLPNGKVLMSGRATMVPQEGERRYLAVALGR
jgi:Flp pilus assembly protein TadD